MKSSVLSAAVDLAHHDLAQIRPSRCCVDEMMVPATHLDYGSRTTSAALAREAE
jgi:hypothetical protein